MLDSDKRDQDGLPKSRGFGFIEFSEPKHALLALRKMNNNPDIFGPNRRPIVEFAIENSKMILKSKQRKEQQQKRFSKQEENENQEEEGENQKKRKSRANLKKEIVERAQKRGKPAPSKKETSDEPRNTKANHKGKIEQPTENKKGEKKKNEQQQEQQKRKEKPKAAPKKKRKGDFDDFDVMVRNQKQRLLSGGGSSISKWLEDE
jgi:nucleolar protein 4